MPFQPGQSGNPAGRPRGARNQTSVLIEQLLEGDAEAIIRKVVDQAKSGNSRALGLLVPAMLPKRKDTAIELDLPSLEQASDAPRVIASIIAAVCAGKITPQEGTTLTRMIEAYVRVKRSTGELGRRPEREKAADVAVAKTSEPIKEAHPPTPVHQPSVNAPAPEAWHPILHAPAGRSLPRLRQQVLSTTSPLAQAATRPGAIVCPLLNPRGSPAASPGFRAAA